MVPWNRVLCVSISALFLWNKVSCLASGPVSLARSASGPVPVACGIRSERLKLPYSNNSRIISVKNPQSPQRQRKHARASLLSMSSQSSLDDQRLDCDRNWYKASKVLMAVTSLLIFLIPPSVDASSRRSFSFLSAQWGGATGFGLVAYAMHILQPAELVNGDAPIQTLAFAQPDPCAEPSAFVSNTSFLASLYRRLSLGTLLFCVLGFPVIPGEAGLWPTAGPFFLTAIAMTTARAVGAWTLLRSLNFSKRIRDFLALVGGGGGGGLTKANLQSMLAARFKGLRLFLGGLRVKDAKKSLFFRNVFLLLSFGAFSNFMQGCFEIRVSSFEQRRYLCWQSILVSRNCFSSHYTVSHRSCSVILFHEHQSFLFWICSPLLSFHPCLLFETRQRNSQVGRGTRSTHCHLLGQMLLYGLLLVLCGLSGTIGGLDDYSLHR